MAALSIEPLAMSRRHPPRVRPYRSEDHDSVVSLWRTVFPEDPPHNAPARVIAEKVAAGDGLLLVADEQGTIVGSVMAGYDGHRGWLYAVAVEPARRRLGIGRHLVEQAIRRLRALGCGKVNLQVRSGNDEAVGFYRRLGFEVEDRVSMGQRLP